MSSHMEQGESLEPITGLYGEAAGESRLSPLCRRAHGVNEEAMEGFQMNWGARGCCD